MCFYLNLNNLFPKIANRDIICYKETEDKRNGAFISDIYPKRYKLNVIQKKVFLETIPTVIGSGAINEGYHSFSTKAHLHKYCSYHGKFIIPKGTEYYYNPEHKEYVSETIIFKGFIKWQ